MTITTKEYIDTLNSLASREMRMQLVYSISAGMLDGPWRDVLAEQFKDHQKQEARHADIVFRRIVALGGSVKPSFEMPPTWGSVDEMLGGIAKLEQDGIREWQALHDRLDADDAFRYTIEDILAEEQDHWDEAKRWRHTRKRVFKEELHVHLPPGAEQVGGVEQADQEAAPVEDEDPEPVPGQSLEQEMSEPAEVYPVVGEARRVKIYGLDVNYLPGNSGDIPIGEAWQDDNGGLHGSGLCRAMLFEPFANRMHINAATGLDTSPLAVFAYRLSLSPFVRVEWEDQDAE